MIACTSLSLVRSLYSNLSGTYLDLSSYHAPICSFASSESESSGSDTKPSVDIIPLPELCPPMAFRASALWSSSSAWISSTVKYLSSLC
mmetsp:Transcript_9285/g.16408  ORF Transcript_9285/g.16408 Transcript_9285/m.16408 type:complete len:89 (+) Transcript_9285:1714-1980(+)